MKNGVVKKLTAVILLASLCLSGCEKKEEEKTSIKVGVTVYDSHDTFISELMGDFNELVTKKAYESGVAISVEVMNAGWNQSTQNSNVEDMIDNGCDILCVNLVDRTAPTAIIDIARQKNVPIIFFNREPVEGDLDRWDHLYYVGTDAGQSGAMQGEIAAEAFTKHPEYDRNGNGEIEYVMIEGESGHPRFKSKRKSRMSYTTNSQECDGSYYVSMLCEYDMEVMSTESKKSVGLDYKSEGLYMTSEGECCRMPHYRKCGVKAPCFSYRDETAHFLSGTT